MSTAAPQWNVNVSNIPSQELNLSTPNPTSMEIIQPASCVYNVPYSPPGMYMSLAAPQWNINVPFPHVPNTFHQKFLKGKPLALGLVLMIAGTINLILGIAMIFTVISVSLKSGNPFWGAVAYITTGILTLSAQSKPSICRVKGSLVMNIVSALMSCVGFVLASLDLISMPTVMCTAYENYYRCSNYTGALCVHALVLVSNLLIICVSIFLGVVGFLSLSEVPSFPQVFVVQNGATVPASENMLPPQYTEHYVVQGNLKSPSAVEHVQCP